VIEGRTILCFASGYDAPPTSKHHVMHVLAETNTVLWVNYHASRTPTASSSDLAHIARKLGQVFGGLTNPWKNLHVLTPLVVPLPSSPWAKAVNRRLLVHQIRSALAKVRTGPVQVWSFTPDVSYLLGRFGEEKVLYYCVDDHASFTGYDRRQVLRDEEDLCRRADLVVTTSTALQEAKKAWNPNTILVPHGVDYEHFRKAVTNNLPTPPDIADIPHPRLGFFGLIRDWVDLDLLAEVARMRPDWHIVMIGDADSNVDLGRYWPIPNIHFLGRKPYADLPAYCRHFDVGLIPFKINELTRAVNPIKLREYLAAGLPVVSTPLPEVAEYEGQVRTAERADAFVACLAECLADQDPARPAARSRAMATETWPAKVASITAKCPAEQRSSRLSPGNSTMRRVLIASADGGFRIQALSLVEACPPNVEPVIVVPQHAFEKARQDFAKCGCRVRSLQHVRKQSRTEGLGSSLLASLSGMKAVNRLIREESPEAVIGIGQRTAVWLLAAAKLFGIRTIFVACVTRAAKPSLTARIISGLGLADRFYVQWPQAVRYYRRAEYRGRLV